MYSQRKDLAERHQLQEVIHTVFNGSDQITHHSLKAKGHIVCYRCLGKLQFSRIDVQHCDVFSTEEASTLISFREGFRVNYDHKES